MPQTGDDVRGYKYILRGDNEDYVWVKQYVDDNGQVYYVPDSSYGHLNEYTTKLKNADTTPLSYPYLGAYKLVKITYELIEDPATIFGNYDFKKGVYCKDIDCVPKNLMIMGRNVVVDKR